MGKGKRFRIGIENRRVQKVICIVLAFCSAFLLTGSVAERRNLSVEAKVSSLQEDLAEEVLRFHVVANSDSQEDQAVKYQVRDAVIAYMRQSLGTGEETSLKQTKEWAKDHLGEIEAVARNVVRAGGGTYEVRAKMANLYFPDKRYGDVWFPKGRYEALRVELGDGVGRNWWCVLYPNLCFTDTTCAVVTDEGRQELEHVLTDEEYEMVTATSDFKIKSFFFGDLFGET